MITLPHTTRILFLDPGIEGTGWAYFAALERQPKIISGVIRPRGRDWQAKVRGVVSEFAGVVCSTKPKLVVAEFPRLYTSQSVSLASGTRGDLFKLSYIVGALDTFLALQTADRYDPIKLISPQEWKGQLPKEVVLRRLEKLTKVKYRDHEGDAVGMGFACMGIL